MKNGTLTTKGNHVELRFERRLAHAPEKVWRALTETQELAHWFPARIEGAREAGAGLQFFFEEGAPGAGKLLVFEPPRLLEYTWEGDVLRWELVPEGKGCLLIFTTIPAERANVARDATGWHFCLDNLEAAVDGTPAAGFDKARFSALNAEYAARFGLGSFPAFLTSAANHVAADSLHIPGVEAYVFDGADGTQILLCHAKTDADTDEQWRDADEYLAVLEGSYVLRINGMDMELRAGREFVVPRGARVSGRFSAGTRTMHAFRGRSLGRGGA
ncbi:SRPBCC domain-containing protein [Polyangium sorediatum]|uniref:SRPBCC domain-containing protein n=1 Tax=Polyangium sorediatum TaxID=889274 RepID=A0ABT6P5C6_9BACT|nr:SRPBCC domain-containing protein [Polyangium sorediatum]MDI1435768.1 SRPBCC domain-containing protein [Polyangium sorediatum]